MLARQAADRKKPFLDPFELVRVSLQRLELRLDRRARLGQLGQHAPHRVDRRIEHALGSRRGTFEPAQSLDQRPLRAIGAERRRGARHVLTNPSRGLQRTASGIERWLLVGLGIERVELGHGMVEEIGISRCCFQRRLRRVERTGRALASTPAFAHHRELGARFGEGVEQGPVVAGIEQAAIVLLAMQLDQQVGETAQHLGRDPAVVDIGLAPSIGGGGPAQDQLAPPGRPASARSAWAGCSGASRNSATTSPWDAPLATRSARLRQPSTKPRDRAGSICPRPSRRSAH